MAIYHLSVKTVSRKQGRSAVGAAAYRSGEKLHNEYDGITHDYTNKSGILHTEIMLPENAPQEFSDRQTLWNAAEKSEKRKDGRTAREIEIALPRELSLDEQLNIVREYVNGNFISRGMCADVAIHSGHRHRNDINKLESKNDKIIFRNNPHAHILLTDRPVNQDGFCGNKDRTWNQTKNVITWREQWANIQNREFEHKGLDVRVSHESNAKRGIDQEPTVHMGHRATALERRGIRTERGNKNRAIQQRNKMLRERQQRIEKSRNQKGSVSVAVQKSKERARLDRLRQQEREVYKIPDRSKRERELRRIRDERVQLQLQQQQEREKTHSRKHEREREK